jgi:hypothetical protein
MLGGAFFWGAFWALAAWRYFKFNNEALFFLGFLTTLSGLSLGLTLYYRLRVIVSRAEDRVEDRDLEIG